MCELGGLWSVESTVLVGERLFTLGGVRQREKKKMWGLDWNDLFYVLPAWGWEGLGETVDLGGRGGAGEVSRYSRTDPGPGRRKGQMLDG